MKRKGSANQKLCLLLAVAMLAVTNPGCSRSEEANPATGIQNGEQTKPGEYPVVNKPLTLKMWATLRKAASVLSDFNQKACFQEMEKATGIHIEFKHPPVGQEKDQFNLLVASNDLPDLIWGAYFKSPADAVANNYVIPLNDYVDSYAPNYKKVMERYPNFKKAMYTDDDKLPGFGFCVPYLEQNIIEGPMFRKDWLDKLGLKVPETIAEWEEVLTAFRDKDPNGNGRQDEIPFDSSKTTSILKLAYAWGVKADFYMEGGPQSGRVRYGPIEPAFKEYLAKMNDWYTKGLINQNYLITDAKLFEANVTGHRTGATLGAGGGFLDTFNKLMQNDPNFLFWPAPQPKLARDGKAYGDVVRLWSLSADARGYITKTNKHLLESIRWFDWGYTPEGELAFNLGKEGVSYKLEKGKLVLTEEMVKNGSSRYTMSGDEHAFLLRPDLVQLTSIPALVQSKKTWGKGFNEFPEMNLSLPPISLTDAEMMADVGRMNEVKTYISEMIDKFIVGKEPIENYDAFVKQVKSMGIEESVKVRQAALERWLKRGNIPFDPKTESFRQTGKNTTFLMTKGLNWLDEDLK